jgi:hypothetical protein
MGANYPDDILCTAENLNIDECLATIFFRSFFGLRYVTSRRHEKQPRERRKNRGYFVPVPKQREWM